MARKGLCGCFIFFLVAITSAPSCADDHIETVKPNTQKTTPAQLHFATSDTSDFSKMPDPQPGDWLHRFNEPGQTFEEYRRIKPVTVDTKRHTIVIQPVGNFTLEEENILRKVVEFAGIWHQLSTRIEEALPLPRKPWQRTNQFPWQEKPVVQYKTDYFLDELLPKRMPKDAVCYIAVTMSDLYPKESWNYVFGQASLKKRVGVYSLVRYSASFWGEEETKATRLQALRRSCKLVTHELGHMFSIHHCIYFECNMNGSNSLEESDRRPLRNCPVCLKKLQWNLKLNAIKRYNELQVFFEENNLDAEATWTGKRLKKIRAIGD